MKGAPINGEISDRVTVEFSSLGSPEVIMLGCYDYNRAYPPLKEHLHPDIFEVCLLERGAQTFMVGSKCYRLAGGDLFITQPGEIHSTGSESVNKGRLYWLEFKRSPNGRSFLGLSPQDSRVLMHRFQSLSGRHFHNADLLAPTFERVLMAHADNQNPLQAAEVRNLLLRLILDIITVAERRISRPCSPGIQSAIHHIEANQHRLPTVCELARVARISQSYFKVQFKKETSMAPVEYAMWQRMERAKQLLRNSKLPVTRLAMDLGFATSQHFATVFKRLTGLTPSAFRRRVNIWAAPQRPSSGAGPDFHPTLK